MRAAAIRDDGLSDCKAATRAGPLWVCDESVDGHCDRQRLRPAQDRPLDLPR
jgi:hypothetical protein